MQPASEIASASFPQKEKRKEAKEKRKTNVNVNVMEIRRIAQKLEDKLSDRHSYKFFCKVARQLPESIIWSEAETALTKGRPAHYFSHVCNLRMRELDV